MCQWKVWCHGSRRRLASTHRARRCKVRTLPGNCDLSLHSGDIECMESLNAMTLVECRAATPYPQYGDRELCWHVAARFERSFSTDQQRAIMGMSTVMHMKSIPIIAGYMPAHIHRYLMLLLRKFFPRCLKRIDRKCSLKTSSCEGLLDYPGITPGAVCNDIYLAPLHPFASML